MIACGRAGAFCRRRRFFQPAQKKRARKLGIETLRPLTRDIDKFEGLLLPVEMEKSGVSLFEKLRETGLLWKKRQRSQRFSGRLKFAIHARGTEFLQQLEIVQQHLLVTLTQNF
ncbi:MAG: hypothetical protein DME65_14845, partial [Verrucomicrobia bacterium]